MSDPAYDTILYYDKSFTVHDDEFRKICHILKLSPDNALTQEIKKNLISRIEFDCQHYLSSFYRHKKINISNLIKDRIRGIANNMDALLISIVDHAPVELLKSEAVKISSRVEFDKRICKKDVHHAFRFKYSNLFRYDGFYGVSSSKIDMSPDDSRYASPIDARMNEKIQMWATSICKEGIVSEIDYVRGGGIIDDAKEESENIAYELLLDHMENVLGLSFIEFYESIRLARLSIDILSSYFDEGGPKGDSLLDHLIKGLSATFSLLKNETDPSKAKKMNGVYSESCREFILFCTGKIIKFLEGTGVSPSQPILDLPTRFSAKNGDRQDYRLKKAVNAKKRWEG